MRHLFFFNFILFVLLSSCRPVSSDLAQKFITLPETVAKPWCYWYWINDDISKEGITKDLLAMKEVGIGAVLIGNINPAGQDGKVPLFSEEWWECMVHAVNEGKRIGIDIGVFNGPGWSQSGGPWNTADKSMRYLICTESSVSGPEKVALKLPKPDSLFQDVRVLAFPSDIVMRKSLNPKFKSFPALVSSHNLGDGNLSTETLFSSKEKTYRIELEFSEIIEANSLFLYPAAPILANCSLYASINRVDSLITEFRFDRSNFNNIVGPIIKGPLALSLPSIRSSNFTLKLSNIQNGIDAFSEERTGLAEIVISEHAVLEKYIEKQLGKMFPTTQPEWNSYSWEEQVFSAKSSSIIKNNHIIDLSEKMMEDGTLNWDVPEGKWTILRFGMTPTGVKNHPASPQGTGFEVDKMDREKVRHQFNSFTGKLLKQIPDTSKTALKYVVTDSYEVGPQNWTDDYQEKFQEKFGYDPTPYLPVLTGRIVGSVTESERFLWDLRRAVADDIAIEYVGGFKSVTNEHNMKLWIENYGHWGFPSEFLKYGGQSDFVSGEFWNEGTLGNYECKAAASAAHIYGKQIVFAEGFTSAQGAFLRHPALLKARGDWSFTQGINHLVLHLYIHQPDDSRKPGVNAWFGTEFNRHNTWFKYASGWTDYLRRSQLLLQQGRYAADVCYFIGEDAPIMDGPQIPELPKGYSFDHVNAEIILTSMTVKDGCFILPNGMTYKLIILPPLKTMRPEVIKKLEELVKEGGVIYGPRPERSPSLENFPVCDEQVREYAAKLWGDIENDLVVRNYGKGKVFNGMDIEEVFKQIDLEKDVDLNCNHPVLWTHRILPEQDIYFITNQGDKKISFSPSFRVKSGKPQLWNPISGEIRLLNEFKRHEGRTEVPLKLLGNESYFVVFDKTSGSGNLQNRYKSNFPAHKEIAKLDGPWQVVFEDISEGSKQQVSFASLTDWKYNPDDRIKYFSGSAVYTKEFEMEEIDLDEIYFINLGEVQVISKVRLNGEDIGITWIKPHILNVKGMLKKGKNRIEIEVANLWRNRMIKEKSLPKNERTAWWLIDDILPKEKLHPSGLIGPVTIQCLVD